MSSGQAGRPGAQQLIGDVQRFGLLSAAAVVDRYTEIINRATRDDSVPWAALPADEPGASWMVDSAAQFAAATARLVDTTAALIASSTTPPADMAELDRLVLPQTHPGARSQMPLWVHNPTSSAAEVDLYTTSLIAASGVHIPVASVTLSPERVDAVDAGGAREVRLRVDVPVDQPAGRYHGLLLISAAPCAPMVLQLDVDDASEGSP